MLQNLFQRNTTTSRSSSRDIKEVILSCFKQAWNLSTAATPVALRRLACSWRWLQAEENFFAFCKRCSTVVLLLQNTFQRRDTSSSRSSSMELPEDVPHRAPPRHSIDVRHASSTRHSIDLSRAHSVRPPGAAAAQASTLSRGSTSQTDISSWDNVSDENKGIIRQVNEKVLCSFVNARAGSSCLYGCTGGSQVRRHWPSSNQPRGA